MNSYVEKYPFGVLIRDFSKYTNISEEEMSLIFNFDENQIKEFYDSTDLTNQPDCVLNQLFDLIDSKMTSEYFDSVVPFDEIEYTWNVGRRLRFLILDELYKRHPNMDKQKFVMVRKDK